MIDVQRAEEVYRRAKLSGRQGFMIAVEPETGDVFFGKTTLEACDLARAKHPKKKFYLKRVGARSTYTIGCR